MLSSCMIRSGGVFGSGEGGAGEFVGTGGVSAYRGFMNEYSELSSDNCSSLDDVSEDSDVGDVVRLLFIEVVVFGTIVSARERWMKHPFK